MNPRKLIYSLILISSLASQSSRFPLETLLIVGSTATQGAVLEIAQLRIGDALDEPAIKDACNKLQSSGLFSSISYRYAPAPKGGIALTLSLADQPKLVTSNIDIPGTDESETWMWIQSKFPTFDHRVPAAGEAQQYVANLIAAHLRAALKGQPIVPRMEEDIKTNRLEINFQPENLPKLTSIAFTGEQAVSAARLDAALTKYAESAGFIDRVFRKMVELNLRPVYEDQGMYRVKFPDIQIRFAPDGSVSATVSIQEGPQYRLGVITLSGDPTPERELLDAAAFKSGQIAKWTEIQTSLYAAERPLKRQGYLGASLQPDRLLDDEKLILNLNLKVVKGPQFHFREVHFQGLSPDLEAQARSYWTLQPGEPFNAFYPGEFLQSFGKKVDLKAYKKYNTKLQTNPGPNTVDVTVVFE